MKIFWLFIIASIVCALLSGQIDKKLKANNQMRGIIIAFCLAICLISIIGIIATMPS